MAAATFPTTLANLSDLVNIRSVTWLLVSAQEHSDIASGELLTADLGPRRWEAVCETPAMANATAEQLMARFELLDGSLNTFYLTNPRALHPQADPDGSILGASDVEIHTLTSVKEMRIDGLPAGYVLTIGDMLSFDYGSPSRRALHRIAVTVTADGSGVSPVFEVRPAIRPGAAVNADVTLKKPAAKVKILPDSLSCDPVDPLNSTIRFRVRQTLQAG